MHKFFEFAGIKQGDKVWDYGCGTGRLTSLLEQKGCKVYSTDVLFGDQPKEKVDKFLLACVLHYNVDAVKKIILLKAYAALEYGGNIVIIEPNPYNPFFYCLYFWRWLIRSKCPRRWNAEKYTSSITELYEMLYFAGFTFRESKKYAWFPSKFGWLGLNRWLNKIPIVNEFNAFNWVKAEK